MFERFTEGAIKVIMLSQEEARRMGHSFVGTEQLLLGVLGQRHGIGAKALKKVRVTLKKARKEIELYIGRGTGFVASEIPFTPRAKRVLEMALSEGKDLAQNFVGTEHILLALLNETDGVAMRTLDKLQVDTGYLRELIYNYIAETQEDMVRPLTQSEKFLLRRDRKGSKTPTLDEFSENVTKTAMAGQLDPVIGREKEINDLVAILARRTKNNPVLMGEPGVGKTAVAEGLAQLILSENVPDFLEGCMIVALDLGSILAGTKYRGEFEERIKRVVEEVQNDRSVVIVIDEIHTLVGAGAAEGAVDAANILKPALARGKFRCIGATTSDEYKKYIERDPALERRFQPVLVEEPSVGVTIEILHGLKSKFEKHHILIYQRKAIEQAAHLADKYVPDRFLPDKAIDVLDEAGARVRLENRRLPIGVKSLMNELKITLGEKEGAMKKQKFGLAQNLLEREMELRTHIRIMKQTLANDEAHGFIRKEIDTVLEDDIANVISNWTGIPVNKITGSETERLLNMENALLDRIIGQKHALKAVANAIRRARVGLRNPNRPIASFIFAGPTGVGKTELTKAVAEYMFTGEDSMIRLDMSEYMEKHTVAKLIGSPPGYVGYNEGGQLTEAVRSKPYSIVLLDEVEKAHPDVFNLLLQILDDGRLTDSRGRVVDFTNTLIVMTTNLGAKVIERESGIKAKEEPLDSKLRFVSNDNIFGDWEPDIEPEKTEEVSRKVNKFVREELKHFFRPEFLNRIDEIIIFNHLTKHDIWDISAIMIKQLVDRLEDKGLTLVVTEPVRALLVEEGHDPLYGARPLRRTIMHYLEDVLAEKCLSSEIKPGTKIVVRRKNFTEYKKEIKNTKDLETIRKLLREATVISRSDNVEKKFDLGGEQLTRVFNLDSNLTKTRSYVNERDDIDFDIIDDEFINPFGILDEQTFTNELIIDIDRTNVIRERKNKEVSRIQKTKIDSTTSVNDITRKSDNLPDLPLPDRPRRLVSDLDPNFEEVKVKNENEDKFDTTNDSNEGKIKREGVEIPRPFLRSRPGILGFIIDLWINIPYLVEHGKYIVPLYVKPRINDFTYFLLRVRFFGIFIYFFTPRLEDPRHRRYQYLLEEKKKFKKFKRGKLIE